MIMRRLIYIAMRVINRTVMPDAAFTSVKEAEEYGKQQYDMNKDYNWYISSVYLENKK